MNGFLKMLRNIFPEKVNPWTWMSTFVGRKISGWATHFFGTRGAFRRRLPFSKKSILSRNQSVDAPTRKNANACEIGCKPDKWNSICIWRIGTDRGGAEAVSSKQ
jgi:hypothetical protein